MKQYDAEVLRKKCNSLRNKFWKANVARNRASNMLENLQKNKNLWKQFCEVNNTSEKSNAGDWMA